MFKRLVISLALSTTIAAVSYAQTAEFGRASAGEVELIAKGSKPFSGSFTLGTSRTFGATFGGTVVPDHVWFFASAEQMQNRLVTPYASAPLSQAPVRAIDSKAIAQIGATQSIDASFSNARQFGTTDAFALHGTWITSPNTFFSVNVSRNGVR